MSQIRYAIQYVLPTVAQKRRQIATLLDFDIRDFHEKERLLKEVEKALEIVKLGADPIIGIALSNPKLHDSLNSTLGMEYVILAKAFDEAIHVRETNFGWAEKNAAFDKMRAEVDELLSNRKPFHWPLEFPEVFIGQGDDAGFSAIIGNPPFQGGQKITGVLGTDYRDYLVDYIGSGKRGSADLCAYFFLRTTKLVKKNGMCALIATNTIAQGDTREVGLDQIISSGWTITRAISSRKWPGEASLEVSYVWLKNGSWVGNSILDDTISNKITSFLTPSRNVNGKPYPLKANENKSFQGSIVLGKGFILDPSEALSLIESDQRNKEVVFPYLNGEDLNSRPDQSPSRWVINFHDWPLEKAETYIDCMRIIRKMVKPERDLNNRKIRRERWWQYAERASGLYNTITSMERVLVCPIFTKHLSFCFVPTNQVFMNKLYVFPSSQSCFLGLLSSNIHEAWARNYSATLETRLQYAPSDCFDTFPFPSNIDRLNDIGMRYDIHRQTIMQARLEGLTKTYNRFHDSHEKAKDIIELRELHVEMDETVAQAYGWDDLNLEHGFHETKQGLRYTISETARREVLDRLLALNHQRHQEEFDAGLVDEQGKAIKAKKSSSTTQATDLKNGINGSAGRRSAMLGKMPSDDLGQNMLF